MKSNKQCSDMQRVLDRAYHIHAAVQERLKRPPENTREAEVLSVRCDDVPATPPEPIDPKDP